MWIGVEIVCDFSRDAQIWVVPDRYTEDSCVLRFSGDSCNTGVTQQGRSLWLFYKGFCTAQGQGKAKLNFSYYKKMVIYFPHYVHLQFPFFHYFPLCSVDFHWFSPWSIDISRPQSIFNSWLRIHRRPSKWPFNETDQAWENRAENHRTNTWGELMVLKKKEVVPGYPWFILVLAIYWTRIILLWKTLDWDRLRSTRYF